MRCCDWARGGRHGPAPGKYRGGRVAAMSATPPETPNPGRRRVAVVFGGRSTEHAISCVSAGSVLAAIDRLAYEVVPVGISREGRWVLAADDPERLAINDGRLPSVDGSAARW